MSSKDESSGAPERPKSSVPAPADDHPSAPHPPGAGGGAPERDEPEFLSDLELGLDDLVDDRMRSLRSADDGPPDDSGASPQSSGVLARPGLSEPLTAATDSLVREGAKAVLVGAGAETDSLFFELGETSLVGRSARCQVQVASAAISLEHARIDRERDGFWLRDLGSTNGTRVNGKRVEGPLRLATGDEVVFADTALLFLTGADERGMTRTAQLPPAGRYMQPWAPAAPSMGPADAVPGPSLVEQIEKVFFVLRFLQRRWRVLTVATVLGGLAGYTAVLLKPPATVVEFEIALTPAPPENPLESHRAAQGQRFEQQFYEQAQRAFVNPKLVRVSLQQLGEPDPAPTRVVSIAQRLQLLQQRESTHLGQLSADDPDWAMRFLSHHVDNFVKAEIERTVRVLQNEVAFLSNTVKEKDDLLRRTEGELRDFKRQHMLHLPEYAEGRLAGAAELEGRRAEASTRASRLTAELELARKRFAREAPLVESKVAEAQPYRQGLAEVNRKLADAKARGLSDRHPEVQQLKREFDELERRADQTARASASDLDRQANPEYTRLKDRVADIEVELGAAQKELGELGGQLGKIDEAVKAMPEAEATYARLTRSYETDKALHARLLERLRRAEIQLELERSSTRARYEVLTAPHSLGINLRKAIATRAGAGLFLGFLLALIAVVFVELRAYLRRLPLVRISQSGRVVQVISPTPDRPALPGG